jgi:hypothetical protein
MPLPGLFQRQAAEAIVDNWFPLPLFWPFLINIWEMNPTIFFKSGPFESRQSDWHDLERGHAICISAFQGAGAWLADDVVPHSRQSHQPVWCNWVTLTALEWLVAQPPCIVCSSITPKQSVRPSHVELVVLTGGKLEWVCASSSSLSLSLFSRSGDCRHLLLCHRYPALFGKRSWATPVPVLPEGCIHF